jgi:hypothetical protein
MTITEKGRRDLVGYIEKNHAVFKQPGDPSKHWDRNSKLKDAYGTDIPVRLSEDHAAPTVMGSEQEMTYEEALTLHLLINEGHAEDDDTSAHRFIINSGFAERFEPGMMRVTESGVTRLGRYVEQHNPNFPSTSLRP